MAATGTPAGDSSVREMKLQLALGRAFAHAWRRLPVRGGGRLIGPLALAHPGARTSTGWAGADLAVDFANPPEASIWLWGTYEPDVTLALTRLIAPGDTCIDIGANAGVHSVLMRQACGPAGRVLAIDPSPAAIARVVDQVTINGYANVQTAQLALGAEPGSAEFLAAGIGIGAIPEVDRAFASDQRVAVDIARLDDVVRERGLAPDVIKIDTDGGEVDILRGATETLARDRPAIVLERCVDGLERRGHSIKELESLLADAGYECWAPVFVPRPRWLVGPGRVGGFRPVSSLAGLDGVDNVVAVDPIRHQGWSGRSVAGPAAGTRASTNT